MKWLAILNPAAHNGRDVNHLRWLAKRLRRELGVECAWTAHPRHAREIASDCNGFDGCIAVGGDGTIFDVVNGLDLERRCLAVIPRGTGNGLGRDLLLREERVALAALRRARFSPVDAIRVRYRVETQWHEQYIISTSSIGYVAEIVSLALGTLKPLGRLRYAAAAYVQRERDRLKELPVRLRLDDEPWQECVLTNLVVNNTRHAGNFRLFPEARLNDGLLNVLYGRVDHIDQLIEDIAILTKTYFFERSQRRTAKRVEVELEQPATLMLDGELVRDVTAAEFHIAPGRLRCCTPPLFRAGRLPGRGRKAVAVGTRTVGQDSLLTVSGRNGVLPHLNSTLLEPPVK